MVEFAIAFPMLMLLFFGTLQLVLIYIDHLVVKYAAFQAARSYIAHIHSNDGKIDIWDSLSDDDVLGPKSAEDKAHLAAAMICTPTTFSGEPDGYIEAPPAWYNLPGGGVVRWPGWSDGSYNPLDGLLLSLRKTQVELFDSDGEIMNADDLDDPSVNKVEVRVSHDLELIFPIVGELFKTSHEDIFSSATFANKNTYDSSGTPHRRIMEKCTLYYPNY